MGAPVTAGAGGGIDCVAIHAAVGAGLVTADVAGLGAIAAGAVAFAAGADGIAGDEGEADGVDAAGGDAAGFGLGADGGGEAVSGGDGGEVAEEFLPGGEIGVVPGEVLGAGGGVEIAEGFAVEVGEAEDDFVGGSGEGGGEGFEIAAVPIGRSEGGEQDGVVAPDGGVGAEFGGDPVEVIGGAAPVGDGAFEFTGVAVDGVLDDEGLAVAAEVEEGVAERGEVFGPEDVAVDVFGQEGDAEGEAGDGVANEAVAGAAAAVKPVAVEGRDVGLVGGRDDHGWAAFILTMAHQI